MLPSDKNSRGLSPKVEIVPAALVTIFFVIPILMVVAWIVFDFPHLKAIFKTAAYKRNVWYLAIAISFLFFLMMTFAPQPELGRGGNNKGSSSRWSVFKNSVRKFLVSVFFGTMFAELVIPVVGYWLAFETKTMTTDIAAIDKTFSKFSKCRYYGLTSVDNGIEARLCLSPYQARSLEVGDVVEATGMWQPLVGLYVQKIVFRKQS